jgi:hypothetical protein
MSFGTHCYSILLIYEIILQVKLFQSQIPTTSKNNISSINVCNKCIVFITFLGHFQIKITFPLIHLDF